MQTIDELIGAAPVFAGLSDAQLALIADCAHMTRVPEGAHLFRAGTPADRFFLIRDGVVSLEITAPGRGTIVIETLHAGEVAGWSWLFEPHEWQFDGRTTEPSALVAFDARCLRGKCEADHELGYELMRRFAATVVERLQATRLQLMDVYGAATPR